MTAFMDAERPLAQLSEKYVLPLSMHDRLALAAEIYAHRTKMAKESADGQIRSKQRKVLAANWYEYGLRLLRQRLLVKKDVRGVVRYLPPTLEDFREWDRQGVNIPLRYRHAARRG